MDSVPYTWRARQGYIPAPAPSPEPEPEVQQPAPIIVPMASFNYQYYLMPQQHPLAYAAPIFQGAAPAPPPAPAPAPAATSASKKSSSSKKNDGPKVSPPPSEAPAATNPNEPPQLRAGMNYMFPAEHTKLHIFNKSSKVWEDRHRGRSL